MTDNEATVAVPVSLLADLQMAMHADDQPRITQFTRAIVTVATTPQPTPRRFRVVDLDVLDEALDDMNFNQAERKVIVRRFDSAPDVMAIVDQEVDQWVMDLCPGDLEPSDVPNLKLRIRTAIEEATR